MFNHADTVHSFLFCYAIIESFCQKSTGVTEDDLRKYQEHGKLVVAGHELSGDDLKVSSLNHSFYIAMKYLV